MSIEIRIARSDEEISRCYPVMAELRPHLSADAFLVQVKRQGENSGFILVYLTDRGVVAVGGIRIAECFAGGKYLEVEDLVTAETARSSGHGGLLFDWIVDYAKSEGCDELKLVSNVTRFGAHRFYLNKRMIIAAHYFSMDLSVADNN